MHNVCELCHSHNLGKRVAKYLIFFGAKENSFILPGPYLAGSRQMRTYNAGVHLCRHARTHAHIQKLWFAATECPSFVQWCTMYELSWQ